MPIHRSVLCALALFVATPAEGRGNLVVKLKSPEGKEAVVRNRLLTVTQNGDASSLGCTVKSDAGSEDVTLVESDAYLHGAASLKALPKTDATLTLTLYDKASASLMSFSGTLDTDGLVTLTPDATKDTGTGTCDASSRPGCTSGTSDTSATSATTLDIEVLAGEVFAASGGYELGLDLAGADIYEVAYAEITVTESDEVSTCSRAPRECTTTTTTTTEVGWDEIGAVWEGELAVEPEGVIDVKVKTYDADGEEVENTKVALAVPWLDGGEGVNVLGIDEDPLTTVGLIRDELHNNGNAGFYFLPPIVPRTMVVNSSGWTATTVPVSAEVELTDGDTITIPVNSYQRVRRPQDFYAGPDFPGIQVPILLKTGSSVAITGGSIALAGHSVLSLTESPICISGACFKLVEDEDEAGSYALSVSVYGTDATQLPDDLELTVTITDSAGKEVYSETDTVEFDDEITAVFANVISFSEDPIGLDLSGEVSLLGAADKKGKQKTLAKGKFYGSFSRDGDGDLALAGADKSGSCKYDTGFIAGETNCDANFKVGSPLTITTEPPPLTPVFGNGSGTKNASSEISTKPELL